MTHVTVEPDAPAESPDRHALWLRFLAQADGVTAIEYGLLGALIAVAIIGALTSTSGGITAIFTAWTNAVNAAL